MDYATQHIQELLASQKETPTEQPSVEPTNELVETPTENVEASDVVETSVENELQTETPEERIEQEEVAEQPKLAVNEKITELNDFLNRNPNKTEADYFNLKKPIDQIDEKELISKYLTEKEGLTPSELKLKLKEMEAANIDEDDDFADELDKESVEYLKAQAEKERLLKKATQFHNEQVQTILAPTESNNGENIDTPAPTEQEVQEFQRKIKLNYDAKIMQSTNEFQGVDIEVGGEKMTIIPSDEEKGKMRETGLKLNEITNKYFTPDGLALDKSDEFAKDVLFWQTPETRNAALQQAYEQGLENGRLSQMRTKQNINNSAKIEIGGADASREQILNKIYSASKLVR